MQRRCLGLAGSSGAESGKILYDFVIRARGASKLAGNPIGSGITLNSIIISAAASKRQPCQGKNAGGVGLNAHQRGPGRDGPGRAVRR